MKKFLLSMVVMLVMATTSLFAGDKTDTRVNWNENVYVSVSGAPTWSLLNSDSKFLNNVNLAVDVTLGKWITPTAAVQLCYEAGALEGGKCLVDHTNLSLEGVVNMSNLFGGIKTRKFDVTLNGGVGWFHTYGTHDMPYHNAPTYSVGIGFNRHLNDTWTIYVNPKWTYVHFTETTVRRVRHSYVSLNIGLVYNFSPRHTHPTRSRETLLNDKIESLAAQVENLNTAMSLIKPDTVFNTKTDTLVVVENKYSKPTVGFNVNSYVIPKTNYTALMNFISETKNDTTPIVIYGYADNNTGTADYNQSLSERRADAVKDFLVSNGIDASRITTEGRGGTSNWSDKALFNRVVVIQ